MLTAITTTSGRYFRHQCEALIHSRPPCVFSSSCLSSFKTSSSERLSAPRNGISNPLERYGLHFASAARLQAAMACRVTPRAESPRSSHLRVEYAYCFYWWCSLFATTLLHTAQQLARYASSADSSWTRCNRSATKRHYGYALAFGIIAIDPLIIPI